MKAGLKPGKFFLNDGPDTGILKSDRIEHPAFAFRNPRRRIPEARLTRGSLEGERAQSVDIVPLGELVTVSKRSAGRNHRVVQWNPAEIDIQFSHRISSFRNTGPSLHTRLFPSVVLHEQPMQAPKPQPIRSSRLNSPSPAHCFRTAFSIGMGPQV